MAKKMFYVHEVFSGEDWIIIAKNKKDVVDIFEECCLEHSQEEYDLEIEKVDGVAAKIKCEIKVE